jgi:hypothetical protein
MFTVQVSVQNDSPGKKITPKFVSLRNMKFSRNPLMQVNADKWLRDEYSELIELYSSILLACDLLRGAVCNSTT